MRLLFHCKVIKIHAGSDCIFRLELINAFHLSYPLQLNTNKAIIVVFFRCQVMILSFLRNSKKKNAYINVSVLKKR